MSVDGSIDYSNYTLDDLIQARGSVNRYSYPRNAQMIDHWINVREGKIPSDTLPPEPLPIEADDSTISEEILTVTPEKKKIDEQFSPPRELSFSKVISDTFLIVWNRKTDLLRVLAPLYIIIILIEFLGLLMADQLGVAGGISISIVSSVAYAMFAVTCHRIVLLGNDSIPRFGILVPSKREFSFWGMTIALTLGIAFIGVAFSMATSFFFIGASLHISPWITVIIIGAPFLYFSARMSLAFPAIALDNFQSLGWCWSATRGNGLSLVALLLIPVTPIYLINYFFKENETLMISGAITLAGFAFAILGIIFISLSYKELCVEVEAGSLV